MPLTIVDKGTFSEILDSRDRLIAWCRPEQAAVLREKLEAQQKVEAVA